jgi:hypothetical protein
MAQVHVLEYSDGRFRIILHTATPTGNNGAGFSWSSLLLMKGYSGRTVMTEGTGPGQISPEEKAQILAGTLLEFELRLEAAPTITGAQLQTLLQNQAPDLITAQMQQWQQELRFWGAVRG